MAWIDSGDPNSTRWRERNSNADFLKGLIRPNPYHWGHLRSMDFFRFTFTGTGKSSNAPKSEAYVWKSQHTSGSASIHLEAPAYIWKDILGNRQNR
jgi:hypothetical protein